MFINVIDILNISAGVQIPLLVIPMNMLFCVELCLTTPNALFRFSYSGTPRARIFARDHVNVHCAGCMLHLMRSNDFKHDPESKCDCNPPYTAENAISARCYLFSIITTK